jgi:hypothetical protein
MQKWHRTPRTAGQLGRLLDLGVQPSLGKVDSLGLLANLGVGFSPFGLFADGSQGVWYDPSDLSTLFQNTTGTTPVTAVEQPVRLMLDKSRGALGNLGPELVVNGTFDTDVNGWTASSANATLTWENGAARVVVNPAAFGGIFSSNFTTVVGRTYRLTVTLSDSTGNVASIAAQTSAGSNISSIPNLSNGTWTLYFAATTTSSRIFIGNTNNATSSRLIDNVSVREVPGSHATASADARRPVLSARVNLLDATTTLATQSVTVVAASHTLSFTGTGTITLTGASTAGPLVGTGVGQRVSLAFTPTAGSLTLTVSGTVTDADLRVTNDGVGLPVYQRVTTSTDYDTAGFPRYLTFDGTDDCLFTGNVDFTATDKVTVCAGVRKLSDAGQGVVAELSADIASNNGTFLLAAPDGATDTFGWDSKGTTQVDAVASGVAAPITRVVTGTADIAGDSAIIRLNGTVADTETGDQGSGNYANLPLFIGARNNASARFNGRLHQLVVVNKLLDATTLTQLETFTNQRTAAY